MRSIIPRVLLSLIFVSLGLADIFHLRIPSKALIDSTNIIVATPNDYQAGSDKSYPFIIMLHGWSDDETTWERDSDLQFLADKYNILLVLPDGGYDSWWQDTDRLPGRDYDTHLFKELKPWLIQTFSGASDPQKHGILGLSMGGYGSFLQVFLHPGEYAAASALSGVMDITIHTDQWGLRYTLGDYVGNEDRWRSRNPLHMLETVQPEHTPPLQLICGRDDFVFKENVAFEQKAQQLGFNVEFLEENGDHSHDFWKTHVNTSVAFIVSKMVQQ